MNHLVARFCTVALIGDVLVCPPMFTLGKKKKKIYICVFQFSALNKLGMVGRHYFFFILIIYIYIYMCVCILGL